MNNNNILLEAFDELLDDLAIPLLAYFDPSFWHCRKIAKKIAKNRNFSTLKPNNIKQAQKDLYFATLKKMGLNKGNENIIEYCNKYFKDTAEKCREKNDFFTAELYEEKATI